MVPTVTRYIICFLVSATLATPVVADCAGSSLNPADVRLLLDAPDVKALDRVFLALNTPEPALRALYRQRRLTFNPVAAEEMRYLKSLPATQAEMDNVYELVDTPGGCGNDVVQSVVYGMFETASRLVKKHGMFHGHFIRLCSFSNAEVGEVAWPEYGWLLENDTRRTLQAVRSLPRKLRLAMCEGADPRNMPDSKARIKCDTDL